MHDAARDQENLRYELVTHFEEPMFPQGIINYMLPPAPIPEGYDELLYFTGLDNVLCRLNTGKSPLLGVPTTRFINYF